MQENSKQWVRTLVSVMGKNGLFFLLADRFWAGGWEAQRHAVVGREITAANKHVIDTSVSALPWLISWLICSWILMYTPIYSSGSCLPRVQEWICGRERPHNRGNFNPKRRRWPHCPSVAFFLLTLLQKLNHFNACSVATGNKRESVRLFIFSKRKTKMRCVPHLLTKGRD